MLKNFAAVGVLRAPTDEEWRRSWLSMQIKKLEELDEIEVRTIEESLYLNGSIESVPGLEGILDKLGFEVYPRNPIAKFARMLEDLLAEFRKER